MLNKKCDQWRSTIGTLWHINKDMSSDLNLLFAQRIRNIRSELKMSQEEFAELCGVDRTYIGRLERIERNPSLDTLGKIACALGISVHELINFDKDLVINYVREKS